MAIRKSKRKNGRTVPNQSHRAKRSKVSQSHQIGKHSFLSRDDSSVSSEGEESNQSSTATGKTADGSGGQGYGELRKMIEEQAANSREMFKIIQTIQLSVESLATRVRTVHNRISATA